MRKLYIAALVALAALTLLSLALNATAILALLRARQIAAGAVADLRAVVGDLGDETFTHTVHVDQDIPVEAHVPFEQEVIVPVNTSVPISTTVIVPIKLGILGTIDIDIPIRTIVPVNLEIAVPISHTIDVATTVPLDLDVPIEIPMRDTPFAGYLERWDGALESIEKRLAGPSAGREE